MSAQPSQIEESFHINQKNKFNIVFICNSIKFFIHRNKTIDLITSINYKKDFTIQIN